MNYYTLLIERDLKRNLGSGETRTEQLNQIASSYLGKKYHGTYASDQIPNLSNSTPYSIVNLDSSDEPGSHWISLAFNDGTVYVYDSFGRSYTEIIPEINQKYNFVVDSDLDAEQHVMEENCGQRCIAWLMVFDRFGKDVALTI